MVDLSPWHGVVVAVGVLAGAVVQGAIGFGFVLVCAPVFALVEPAAVPATPLLLAFPLNAFVIARERDASDLRGLRDVVPGLVLGTVAGAVVLATLPAERLTIAIGAAIVAVAATSALRPAARPRRSTRLSAGVASGLFNTVAGTGGPPIALVYRDRPGPELRATLGITFLIAGLLSTIALVAAGRIGADHVVLAAALSPALAVGAISSRTLARALDERWLRPAVIVFAAVSGAAAVARGLASL